SPFHAVDLGFQGCRGGRSLTGIRETGAALKDGDQVFHPFERVLRRGMERFVNGSGFGAQAPVGMQDVGGEAVSGHRSKWEKKNRIEGEGDRMQGAQAPLHPGSRADGAQPQPAPWAARRCLTVSYKQTALATLTFRLSTEPSMGICTSSSQVSRVSRRMPSPSAPITQAMLRRPST